MSHRNHVTWEWLQSKCRWDENLQKFEEVIKEMDVCQNQNGFSKGLCKKFWDVGREKIADWEKTLNETQNWQKCTGKEESLIIMGGWMQVGELRVRVCVWTLSGEVNDVANEESSVAFCDAEDKGRVEDSAFIKGDLPHNSVARWCNTGVGNLRPAWTFYMALIRIFVRNYKIASKPSSMISRYLESKSRIVTFLIVR